MNIHSHSWALGHNYYTVIQEQTFHLDFWVPVSVLYLNLVFPCARKSVYVHSGEKTHKAHFTKQMSFSLRQCSHGSWSRECQVSVCSFFTGTSSPWLYIRLESWERFKPGRCSNLECCYHCPPHKIQEDNGFATVTEILCIRITVIQYQQTGPWVWTPKYSTSLQPKYKILGGSWEDAEPRDVGYTDDKNGSHHGMADTIKRLHVSRPKSVTSRDTEGPVS